MQKRARRVTLQPSWHFPRVAVRGDLGLDSLKYRRHKQALKYASRLRTKSPEQWQRVVGEELLGNLGKGTRGDCVVSLMHTHNLKNKQTEAGWNIKDWEGMAKRAIREASEKSCKREVTKRADQGNYQEQRKKLELTTYIKKETGDNKRKAIKERTEWEKHWD